MKNRYVQGLISAKVYESRNKQAQIPQKLATRLEPVLLSRISRCIFCFLREKLIADSGSLSCLALMRRWPYSTTLNWAVWHQNHLLRKQPIKIQVPIPDVVEAFRVWLMCVDAGNLPCLLHFHALFGMHCL